jgi:hypothetical protein
LNELFVITRAVVVAGGALDVVGNEDVILKDTYINIE